MATELEWTLERTFRDHRRAVTADGPGTYDVPDDAVEEYLDHRTGGWQRPDEGDSDDSADSETEDGGESADGPNLEEMDFRDLQSLAGEHDDVKGNQSEEDLRAALREKLDEE